MLHSRLALLRQTASVLVSRNVSEANLPFVLSRIKMVRSLCNSIGSENQPLGWLKLQALQLSLANYKAICASIMSQLPAAIKPTGGFVHLSSFPTIQTMNYARVVVYFSPEIGIGDEVSFYQLLRQFAPPSLEVWTTIPEIWHRIGFRKVHSYLQNPNAPFSRMASKKDSQKTLIIYIGFLDGDFVESTYPDFPGCHLLQITLGNHQVLYWTGGKSIHIYRSPVIRINNYEFIFNLGSQLFAFDNPSPKLYAVRFGNNSKRSHTRRRVLVNPLTSKLMIISLEQWTSLIETVLISLDDKQPTKVCVLAGFTPATQSFSAALVSRLRAVSMNYHVDLLKDQNGNLPDMDHAMDLVLDQMENSDLLIGMDTYTAHLAPLFDVTCYTVFYKDDKMFRIPFRNTLPLCWQASFEELLQACRIHSTLRNGFTPNNQLSFFSDVLKINATTDRLRVWFESASDVYNPYKDFRYLANAKESVRKVIGKDKYASITYVCGRPWIFDVRDLANENAVSIADQKGLVFDWLANPICHLLEQYKESESC